MFNVLRRLWARLMLHFWALQVERCLDDDDHDGTHHHDHPDPDIPHSPLDPVEFLQRAYERTIDAASYPGRWLGTTTSVTAVLDHDALARPSLLVTNVGDSRILVIRPAEQRIVFRTTDQYHWFDCPRQLGTNSPDTPRKNAVCTRLELDPEDIVVAVSDGVVDNLWEHEVLQIVLDSMAEYDADDRPLALRTNSRMVHVARTLHAAAKNIAQDPEAESPYMEKAIQQGLSMQGGGCFFLVFILVDALRLANARR